MTRTQWACLAMMTALCGGTALAHDADELTKLDANHDGNVSPTEFEAHALDHFDNADANHDGKVTGDELKGAAGDMFSKADINGDGKLDKNEAKKFPPPVFKKLDANNDGFLTKEELEKAPELKGGKSGPAQLPGDTDKDGTLTKAEATQEAQVAFKKLDANNDGSLSKEELAKLHGMAHGAGGKLKGKLP
jgi:Ca2+-binding EF-hand superfamily protein